MGSIFYVMLNMSITAAAAGLAVALIRLVSVGKLPPLMRYALWAIVLLRLILPFSLPSKASFFNAVGAYVTRMASVRAGGTNATITNSLFAVNGYFPMHFKTDALEDVFRWAGIVWLAGAALALVSVAMLYLFTANKFRTAARADLGSLPAECAAAVGLRRIVPVVASGEVSSPVVFGLVRPRIVIPPGLIRDRETLRYSLLHECVHIRRGDNLWRALSALAVCVHWFNPLVWLFFRLAGRDMELACDSGVLKKLDRSEHRGYAEALAGMAGNRQPLLAAAFGMSAVKRRVIGIVRYKRLTLVEIVLSIVLLLGLAAALLSNPAM